MSEGATECGNEVGLRLNAQLELAGLKPLDTGLANRFEEYLSLLLRWNARVNLTSIRDQEGIISRHFVESIACAFAVPTGIATLLDFGSGAGFPGIPIALCRPEIAVTLAESQGKKAAFLQEAVRVVGASAKVHSGRAETLSFLFDCVVLRAVDHMPQAVQTAGRFVAPNGWLALMTTGSEIGKLESFAGPEFTWRPLIPLPGAADRSLALGLREARRVSSPA